MEDPEDPGMKKLAKQQGLTTESLRKSDEAIGLGQSILESFSRQKNAFQRIISNVRESNELGGSSQSLVYKIKSRIKGDKMLILLLTVVLVVFIIVSNVLIKYFF
jgi:sensor domain CHASE-containing protein